MAKLTSLGKWREGKDWTQYDLADKLGVPRPTFQKMESGVGPLPPKIQAKIRKLDYTGPWPREEAKAGAQAGGATREDFEAVLARLRMLEASFQTVALMPAAVKDLDERVQRVERHAGFRE